MSHSRTMKRNLDCLQLREFVDHGRKAGKTRIAEVGTRYKFPSRHRGQSSGRDTNATGGDTCARPRHWLEPHDAPHGERQGSSACPAANGEPPSAQRRNAVLHAPEVGQVGRELRLPWYFAPRSLSLRAPRSPRALARDFAAVAPGVEVAGARDDSRLELTARQTG